MWQRVISLDFATRETHHLLYCAKMARKDLFLLDFRRQLRERGYYDRDALIHEVETMVWYSEFAAARDALREYLQERSLKTK